MFQERQKENLFRSAFILSMDYLTAGATYIQSSNKTIHKSGKWLNSECLKKHVLLLRTVAKESITVSIHVFNEETLRPNTQPSWSAHFLKMLDDADLPRLYVEVQTPDGYKRKWFGVPDIAIKTLLSALSSASEEQMMLRTMPEHEFDLEARYILD